MVLARAVRAHVEASDAIWLIYSATRNRWSRWCLLCSLRLCEWTALVPPPPMRRAPALRYIFFISWWCTSVAVTSGNQYLLLKNAREYIRGFSTISMLSYVTSTIMTAIQPEVVLCNSAVNFRRLSPHMAGLLMPPLRFHGWFVVSSASMVILLIAKHALLWVSQRKSNFANGVEFLAAFITLSFDMLVVLLCQCAQDKLYDINSRLANVGRVIPELRALVLESAARQYELTADQVGALGTIGVMGLPLACNSVRHRVKLVTDSFVVYRTVENFATQHPGTLAAIIVQLMAGAGRIVAHSMAGERLYRESKRTLSLLGAVDASGWPDREIQMVDRILRNSRRGVALSMGGMGTMDHGFLLSVIGSTVTYLVVLMQYKDPSLAGAINGTASNVSVVLPS